MYAKDFSEILGVLAEMKKLNLESCALLKVKRFPAR